ncbi:aminodeoxychorismate synthase component I [Virgibacillus sp. LDC-1]|uniref:aminodeoxychorismate synthase component I n=1 Tax=Virgibacillus sp. LDC-1 TaxID=3039856 RepID=UPI0024DE850E|nr:aminodeoxychorismate synthase component I [Virgibacillus sp. LDC-1]
MIMDEQNNRMIFDFAAKQNRERLLFEKPEKIVAAYKPSEVLKAMQEIDTYIHAGWYAAGYISYEAGKGLDDSLITKENNTMPFVYFGIYKEPVKIPFQNNQLHDDTDINLNWEMNESEKDYKKKVDAIKKHISDGDTYQVNYTVRLSTDDTFDDARYYEQLLKAQDAKYSAYLDLGRFRILSVSPELFFEIDNGKISTKPMKGTIKRGRWFEEDIANRNVLVHSEKDKAENLMIVDLLRNDLSKIAKTGTVQVPKLFEVEQYPTVYQLTSTVTADLVDNISFTEIFQALFPCGSITGAPKVSTMAIINELEATPREIYCGSIGYITPKKQAVFNVAIRTLMVDTQINKAYYGVGGGITWESTSDGEYKEAIAKSAVLYEKIPSFELMETIRYEHNTFYLIENHLERIYKSAQYFNIPFHGEDIKKKLTEHAETLPKDQITKVNLFVDLQGNCRIKSSPFDGNNSHRKARLASSPILKDNKFLYHKTTNRALYEKHKEGRQDEILLWNEEKELTEFTIGNLVVKWEQEYWTPPIESGLLPGTLREHLIRTGKVKERKLLKENIKDFEEIWLINSLRGWVKINLV